MFSFRIITITLWILFLIGCSPKKIKIGDSYSLGEVPKEILEAQLKEDPFLENLKVEMKDLPGHDDLIFDTSSKIAYASGMDGWIWRLDFQTETAERWFKPPVNPAGMSFSNQKKDKILFCASRLGGEVYNEDARVGLYEVEISSKKLSPLVLELPLTDAKEFDQVYKKENQTPVLMKDLNASNSRKFSLCNDLAVTSDGNRVYLTEPFEREDAAMGSGAVPEAIGLYPHGKLWLFDRDKNSISLVLNGFTFIDGILLEEDSFGKVLSVIFTETTKFRILRAYIDGPGRGEFQVLHENLPGLADGLERDEKNRIWVGIIKPRSKLINFVHKHPKIKPLLLNIPPHLLPIVKQTGVLILDPSGKEPLAYVMHKGTHIKDISVAVPHRDRVFFPVFDKSSRGLYSLPLSSFMLGEK